MFPASFAQPLFSLILSGLMSCAISGLATYQALGAVPGFVGEWMRAWAPSWALAFPLVLVLAPLTRRIVVRLTRH